MNLPLHPGWPGALEAGLIALLVGALAYALFHAIGVRARWAPGPAIGWACLVAVAIAAGTDIWHLFYMGVVKLESPVYARIALSKIHDPNGLGARVLMEVLGAFTGVGLAWMLAGRGSPWAAPGPLVSRQRLSRTRCRLALRRLQLLDAPIPPDVNAKALAPRRPLCIMY